MAQPIFHLRSARACGCLEVFAVWPKNHLPALFMSVYWHSLATSDFNHILCVKSKRCYFLKLMLDNNV